MKRITRFLMIGITTALTLALLSLTLFAPTYGKPGAPVALTELTNVRAFVPASTVDGKSYAVDGGLLYAGKDGLWSRVETPAQVVVNAVAVDSRHDDTLYIGAGNRLALYVSRDAGQSWQAIPLSSDEIGGVTALAVDGVSRIVYAGSFANGLFRLRDVGSSLIAAGHLLLDEAVAEIVADPGGSGLALVRTEWHLYRAEEQGLRWVEVTDLPSPATALALTGTTPPTVLVGTASSGILRSQNGIVWEAANGGLPFTPGSQLYISALAPHPLYPQVIYAAHSLTFGSANAHITPVGVAMSENSGAGWALLAEWPQAVVTDLLPAAGRVDGVYGLTVQERTPVALGNAPEYVVVAEPVAEGGRLAYGTLAWALLGAAAGGLAVTLILALADWHMGRSRRQKREDGRRWLPEFAG